MFYRTDIKSHVKNFFTSRIALFIDEQSVSPFPWIRQLATGLNGARTNSSTFFLSVSRQSKMLSPEKNNKNGKLSKFLFQSVFDFGMT